MNLDHDFVQVGKFSEDPPKKNANGTLCPQIQVKTKKKVFIKNSTFFPNLRSDIHPFKLLGGCRCGPFSRYWGYTAKLLGGYIPLVSATLLPSSELVHRTSESNCCSVHGASHCYPHFLQLLVSEVVALLLLPHFLHFLYHSRPKIAIKRFSDCANTVTIPLHHTQSSFLNTFV